MNTITKSIATLALTVLVTASGIAQAIKVDATIPRYKKKDGISGKLSSIGSDTMNNLLALWGEGFKKFYPNVVIEFEGKGSSTAPPALLAGTAQLGPMSREMKGEEIDRIEKKYGFKPSAINTALDGLAVYVHKDNKVKQLTMEQLDAIFSKTRRGGYAKDITQWSDVDASLGAAPISLYGRNSASGTYGFFKEHALYKGDFKDGVKEQPGSAAVVQGISRDRNAIGYSGIGYSTSGVRAVPIAKSAKDKALSPTYDEVETGKYPISRFLFLYILKNPNKPLDPLVKEFLTYVLSFEGQTDVAKEGYYPLSARLAERESKKLD